MDDVYCTDRSRSNNAVCTENVAKEHSFCEIRTGRHFESCVICQTERLTVSRRLRCGHCFCFRCITSWIHENPSCPLCREEQYNLNWPSVCIACGEQNCQNPHSDLDHEICIELIENVWKSSNVHWFKLFALRKKIYVSNIKNKWLRFRLKSS
jgi:hypothetical protein